MGVELLRTNVLFARVMNSRSTCVTRDPERRATGSRWSRIVEIMVTCCCRCCLRACCCHDCTLQSFAELAIFVAIRSDPQIVDCRRNGLTSSTVGAAVGFSNNSKATNARPQLHGQTHTIDCRSLFLIDPALARRKVLL